MADVRVEVDQAWSRVSQDLFACLDRIQEQAGLGDADMLTVVESRLGLDIADEYEDWLDEGDG